MKNYRVGCVPYLNAKPLTWELWLREPRVEVVYDVPSRLPQLLKNEEVAAILVSSIDALRTPGARVAAGVSISTQQEVTSVRLFSRVPFTDITKLALDASSMTSNALVQILLREKYECRPEVVAHSPDLESMLRDADAAVLIGDQGMAADGGGLFVLDLGTAWFELSGLPFVWALWVGGSELDDELASRLEIAARYGEQHLSEIVPAAANATGFSETQARTYLAEIMDYHLEPNQVDGLMEFGRLLVKHNLIETLNVPTFCGQGALNHVVSER